MICRDEPWRVSERASLQQKLLYDVQFSAPETGFFKQYQCHFHVGWVERSETQRICWVSCLNPTNQKTSVLQFGTGIVKKTRFLGCLFVLLAIFVVMSYSSEPRSESPSAPTILNCTSQHRKIL